MTLQDYKLVPNRMILGNVSEGATRVLQQAKTTAAVNAG